MNLVITIIFLAFVVWFGWHVYTSFKAATGTVWERFYSATKDSATLFWGTLVAWVTSGMNGLMNLSDFLGAPEVRDFITKWCTPEIASGVIVGVVLVITLARLRTLRT